MNNIKSNGYQNLNDLNYFAFCQKRQPKCTDIFFFFFTYMDICIHNRTKIYLFAYNLILHSSNVIIHSEQVVINLKKKKKEKNLRL